LLEKNRKCLSLPMYVSQKGKKEAANSL